MFQPFSQENPSHTGTGLGLAIVNSIVKSEGLNGKVEVFSTEGAGTEIRVTFEVDPPSQRVATRSTFHNLAQASLGAAKVCLHGFDEAHRGQVLLKETLSLYMTDWWGVRLVESRTEANILFINDKLDILMDLVHREDVHQPVVFLTAARGNAQEGSVIKSYEELGGRCFILYKPCRPSNLIAALEHALNTTPHSPTDGEIPLSLRQGWRSGSLQRSASPQDNIFTRNSPSRRSHGSGAHHNANSSIDSINSIFTRRRHSDEAIVAITTPRPPPLQRRFTDNPKLSSARLVASATPSNTSETGVGNSSLFRRRGTRQPRVLIVEDNNVNRALLAQWLRKKVNFCL